MKIGASSFVMTRPANEKASKTWHHLQSCQTSILDFRVNFTGLIGVLIVISRHKPTQSKLLSYNQHRENNLKGKIQVEAKLVSSFFFIIFYFIKFSFYWFFSWYLISWQKAELFLKHISLTKTMVFWYTVEPVSSSTVLSGHPVLNDRSSDFRVFIQQSL